jgi:hypothetical protein
LELGQDRCGSLAIIRENDVKDPSEPDADRLYGVYMLEIAGVAKLVDAKDLKSFGSKELCRFDPGRPHQVIQ